MSDVPLKVVIPFMFVCSLPLLAAGYRSIATTQVTAAPAAPAKAPSKSGMDPEVEKLLHDAIVNPCGPSAVLAIDGHYMNTTAQDAEVARDANGDFKCRIIQMDTKTADVSVEVEQGVFRWTVNLSFKWDPKGFWSETYFNDHGKHIAVTP